MNEDAYHLWLPESEIEEIFEMEEVDYLFDMTPLPFENEFDEHQKDTI